MTIAEVYLVEEEPIDPHYPPHVISVYANEANALDVVEGESHRSVREASIEDIEVQE